MAASLCFEHLPGNTEPTNDTIYGVELSHYIYVSAFSLTEYDSIEITYETYGEEFTKNWSLNEFLEAYRGEICFYNPDTYKLQQTESPEEISPAFGEPTFEQILTDTLKQHGLFKRMQLLLIASRKMKRLS